MILRRSKTVEPAVVNTTVCVRLVGITMAAACILLLKLHYSAATADQLRWVLAPTARLISWLTPAQMAFEAGAGYVDSALGIIIAPACAGINFMIMLFGLGAYLVIRRTRRLADVCAGLGVTLALAYAATLAVNTLRIAVSLMLYHMPVYGDIITPARLHRLTGVVIYFWALWLSYGLATRIIGRCNRHQPALVVKAARCSPRWLPYACYLFMALGVPWANGMLCGRPPHIGEHGATIMVAMVAFRTIEWLARHGYGALIRKESDGDACNHTDCRG